MKKIQIEKVPKDFVEFTREFIKPNGFIIRSKLNKLQFVEHHNQTFNQRLLSFFKNRLRRKYNLIMVDKSKNNIKKVSKLIPIHLKHLKLGH